MRHPRTALPLCLLALLPGPAPAAPDGGAPGLAVRSGRVEAVDWSDRRVTLLGPGGRDDLGFDRNTVVYLPGRPGTMRDVEPGLEVRAAANPDGVAAWIAVRPASGDGGAPGDGGTASGPAGGPPAHGGAGTSDGGAPDGGTPR